MAAEDDHGCCECGKPYPKRLKSRLFWTASADAELMRLRNEGMAYNAIAKALNERHALRISTDSVYYRHVSLITARQAAPPRAVMAPPRPTRPDAECKPEAPPAATVNVRNRCADFGCTRQRAAGYSLCLAHLPPMETIKTKGET